MRKVKGFFALSMAFCLFMSNITPTLAEEAGPKEEDVYVLCYSGDIEGYEDYDQKFMYPSPHVNYLVVDENGDGINESHWNWTGHKTYNMINTTLLEEGGTGPFASTSVYCFDAITDGHPAHKYRRINLEDATYFSNEKAQRLRAVLRNSFPYETDMEALEERINEWNPATDSNAIDLTEAECITATQSVIWHITNNVEIRKPYLETVKTRFETYNCMYPEYLLDPVKASDSNATNISLLCDYLLDLEPEEADETVISNNSFLNEEIVYFTDIDKTLLTAEIEANIAENSEIYLVTEYKGFKSEKILLKDGIQEYGILFDGKIDDSNIVLTLSGKQYAEDVFLYEPYYEDGETARSASQTMAGYSAWTLPVYVEKTINFNNIEETTSIAETTPEETTTTAPETIPETTVPGTSPEETIPEETTTTIAPTTERETVREVKEPETTVLNIEPTETLPVVEETIEETLPMGVLGEMDENETLAVLPMTGDRTGLWGLLAALSGLGLIILSFAFKEEEN